MSLRKNSEIESIQGDEGTNIKQYFHPHNTLNGINYSLAQFTLEPGKKSKLHKIKSSEIYYILEGSGRLKVDDEFFNLQKDDSIFVPPNSEQFIENTGTVDLRFLCIVEPAWKATDETILE
ncbi:MAG: cupin domain-containing protein [Nitrosopumilus sp.]|uniref:cupin domain-containing protein n=1 Tax=Nitrosopumilus sp. TaxID=2024843 RepID=UPI00247B759D|nr:cupin domain-containing protein [Nitrosopumilus sp.]MCV0392452.1 cupin domain-containing protein [Nitrosopumilus sp.]